MKTTESGPAPVMDGTVYNRIKKTWDHIAKPLDGMGLFEELTCRIGAVLRDDSLQIDKRCVVVMCADNGIVEEGISQSDQDVTYSVASWMGKGISTVCRLSKAAHADVIPVDIGINSQDTPEGVLDRKVGRGTANFLKTPAMTEEECRKAIGHGIALAEQLKKDGYTLIAQGEMGIGNTTTAAALVSLLSGNSDGSLAGRGAGLNDEKLLKKRSVLKQAYERYAGNDVFSLLAAVGGFDIAGLTGLFIGGARYHIPVIIDGAISAAAALCAERMEPGTVDCMIPSHVGREPVARTALSQLGLDRLAVLHAEMALGEGSGAVMMFPLLDTALALYHNGIRFAETEVGQYERYKKDTTDRNEREAE